MGYERTEEVVEIYVQGVWKMRTEETGRKGWEGRGKIPVAVTLKPELDRQEIVLIPWQNAALKQDNIFVFFSVTAGNFFYCLVVSENRQ